MDFSVLAIIPMSIRRLMCFSCEVVKLVIGCDFSSLSMSMIFSSPFENVVFCASCVDANVSGTSSIIDSFSIFSPDGRAVL